VSAPDDAPPEVRYEQSDVHAEAIVRFAIGLVIVVVVSSVALLGLFKLFAGQQRRQDPPPPPLLREAGRLPPAPRLQETPLQDLEQLRAKEEKELTSYGWVDPQAGIVHIPIDDAIKIVARGGIPKAIAMPSPPVSVASPSPPEGGRR
jgi:hypothetical protein